MEEGVKGNAQAFFATTSSYIMEEELFTNISVYFNSSADNRTEVLNYFSFYESVQFAVMWILFVAIVVGNSSVIAVMLLTKTRKSRMNFFILQLATADLFVGLVYLLADIVQRITIVWSAGVIACKFIKFTQAVSMYASTYVLVALSIDRCDAITNPMNFSGSWIRARILVGTAWVLSILFSVPLLMLYEVKEIQGYLQCWIELGTPNRWQIWVTLVSLTIFVLPALTIAACYIVIVITIWTKSKAVAMSPAFNQKNVKVAKNGVATNGEQELESRRASSRGLIPRAKIKSVKMTFVIVFVFVLCWSPYIVFDLLQVYNCLPRTQTIIAWATLIQSLVPLNSAANPLICCLFSPHICHGMSRIPPYSWIYSKFGGRHPGTLRSRSNSTAQSELISTSQKRSNKTHINHSGATMLNSSRPRLDSSSSDLGSRRSQVIFMATNNVCKAKD